MQRQILACLSALLGLPATVQAANLSMRFASGGGEITLAPGGDAVIEIVWTMAPQDKTARNLGALGNRFDVTGTANIEVSAVSTTLAGWGTSVSSGIGGPLSALFASAAGTNNPIRETTAAFETTVQQITIQNVDGEAGSVQIAFRVSGPLPDAITSTAGQWTLVAVSPGAQQFDVGLGSPGYVDSNDAQNPAAPLVIHLIPAGSQGGGGGADPGGNTNDNTAPPADPNDNTPIPVDANDNVVVIDDGGGSSNDNASDSTNDNDAAPPDNANENAAGGQDGGGAVANDNRSGGGGGGGRGGGGGTCGIGMAGVAGWMFAALALLRFSRRRGSSGPMLQSPR